MIDKLSQDKLQGNNQDERDAIVSSTDMLTNKLSQDKLQEVQTVHLQFLEDWAAHLPTIDKIPVAKALTYELVQVLNNAYLRDALEEVYETSEANKADEVNKVDKANKVDKVDKVKL